MSKTRKLFIVIFLVVGSVLIVLSFLAKLEHWSNMICCTFALSAFLLATTALVLTLVGAKKVQ